MKYSFNIYNFLEEIDSLTLSFVFLYFFALFIEKHFLSLLAILYNSSFSWVYLSLSPLLFASLISSAAYKASPDNHFALLHLFFFGMVLFTASCTILWTTFHSSSGTPFCCCCCSFKQSHLTLYDTMDCSTPGFLYLTISRSLLKIRSIQSVISSNHLSSVIPYSTYLPSFPVTRCFPMSRLSASGGQSIGASASASVLPMSIQGWFHLGLTGLISFQSKGLSRVFSNTTVWKHQFFSAQLCLQSNSHIHTWLLEKP